MIALEDRRNRIESYKEKQINILSALYSKLLKMNINSKVSPYIIKPEIMNNNKLKMVIDGITFVIITSILDNDFLNYVTEEIRPLVDLETEIIRYCQLSSIFPDQIIEIPKINTVYLNYSRNDLFVTDIITKEKDEFKMPIYTKKLSNLSLMSILSAIGIFYHIHKANNTKVDKIISTIVSLCNNYTYEDINISSSRVQNGSFHRYINIFNSKYIPNIKVQTCSVISTKTKLKDHQSSQGTSRQSVKQRSNQRSNQRSVKQTSQGTGKQK